MSELTSGDSSDVPFTIDNLCLALNIPLGNSSVIDLSEYVDCGEFMAAGGSGTVYEGKWREETLHYLHASDASLLPKIVMKVINIPSLTDEKAKNKRFKNMKRELELWGSTRHERILPLFGIACVDNDANRPAFVSPRMQHGNISEFLKQNPEFPALRFLRDIIEGVHYLHNFDPEIVHGDIKAANVLITDRAEACLCDFGLSRFAVDNTLWRTTATHAGGTLRWMAPELLEDVKVPTKASDIYAYAMTCYEILTGNVPFKSVTSEYVLMCKVLEGKRPEYVVARYPEIWNIITRCWAQEPNDRPPAGEVLGLIQNIIKEPFPESLKDDREIDALLPVRGFRDLLVSNPYLITFFLSFSNLSWDATTYFSIFVDIFNWCEDGDVVNPSSTERGVTTLLIMPICTIIGVVSSMELIYLLGRKNTAIFAAVLWFFGSICQCINIAGLIEMGGVAAGISVGLMSVVIPIYQAEITIASIRGRIMAFQQLSRSCGILIQFAILYKFGISGFHIFWGLQSVFAVIFGMVMMLVPESPRWLFHEKKKDEALQALADLHGNGNKSDAYVQFEYEEIKQQQSYNREKGLKSYLNLLKPVNRRRLLLGASLSIWTALARLPVGYATQVICLGRNSLPSVGNTFILRAFEFILGIVMTIPAILYIDKWGRRPMLMTGTLMLGFILYAAGALDVKYGDLGEPCIGSWSINNGRARVALVGCLYFSVCVYSITVGPASWAYSVELYSSRIRAKVVALTTAMSFIFNSIRIITNLFSPFTIEAYSVFFILGTFNFAAFVLVLFTYPETAGRTLEGVEDVFKQGQVFSAWKIRPGVVNEKPVNEELRKATKFWRKIFVRVLPWGTSRHLVEREEAGRNESEAHLGTT